MHSAPAYQSVFYVVYFGGGGNVNELVPFREIGPLMKTAAEAHEHFRCILPRLASSPQGPRFFKRAKKHDESIKEYLDALVELVNEDNIDLVWYDYRVICRSFLPSTDAPVTNPYYE